MTAILEWLNILMQTLVNFMWGNWMIFLLVGTGILLSFMTRFIQLRKFVLSIRYLFQGGKKSEVLKDTEGDISPFAALMTALAATVGNGNIAGVAAAIATGGPGAPFWMWISGLFGMATKFSECYLGVKYRKVAEDGSMAGGPMYYIRHGIKNQPIAKFLGMTFAVCGGMTALLGTGNMMQSNAMALAIKTQFGVPTILSAFVITVLVGIVILGGIKRIGAVAEKLVPTMILFYIGGALVILITKHAQIGDAFVFIFKSAFSLQAAGGALIGTSIKEAISLGVRRGVLSNEAGLGSAAIAQSAAKSPDPMFNGLLGMTGVFIDTILVNTITTLTIVVTGVWKLTPACGVALVKSGDSLSAEKIASLHPSVNEMASTLGYDLAQGGLSSTALTVEAFNSVIPFGGIIIAIGSLVFGYTTLLGWAYYGEQCIGYIWGVRSHKPYRIVFISLLFFGALLTGKYMDIVWNIGDSFNAVMALPNLIGLLFLAQVVSRATKKSLDF
ncbi:MAG TPA: sodium:alanine symporter family protein [bacterium]|nr:sodium:alanine symporter family protein [bacterium]